MRAVLDHLVIFGPRQLERVLRGFIDHYHTARPRQGLASGRQFGWQRCGANLIQPKSSRIDRLGGLIYEYVRAA